MAEAPPSTCTNCGGDGIVDDDLCTVCMGGGSLPVTGIALYFKKHITDMEDKLEDIMDKCDDIKEVVDAL